MNILSNIPRVFVYIEDSKVRDIIYDPKKVRVNVISFDVGRYQVKDLCFCKEGKENAHVHVTARF